MKTLTPDQVDGIADYVVTHQQVLYTFCYRVLGDEQRAQTVVQRVFEQAWPQMRPDAERQEALRLLSIACREVRKASPGDQLPSRSSSRELVGSIEDGLTADIQLFLATLPAQSRCVVVLRCCCALTPEEVSIVTGLSVDEVGSRVIETYRALACWSLARQSLVPMIGLGGVANGHRKQDSVCTT